MKSRIVLAVLALALGGGTALAQTESEPNDDRFSANAMNTLPTTLTGGLPGSYGGGLTDDYWSFPATAGTQYEFVATPQNTSAISPLDIDLGIENSSGNLIAIADANGDNEVETLNWTAPTTDTYYLVVWEGTSTAAGIPWYEITVAEVNSVDDWSLY